MGIEWERAEHEMGVLCRSIGVYGNVTPVLENQVANHMGNEIEATIYDYICI